MPEVDLVDATWIAAPAASVAEIVSDKANWPLWWPGMEISIDCDRGELGLQWLVARSEDFGPPAMTGSMEIWLEAAFDGVVLHYFLRLDRIEGQRSQRLGRRRLRQLQRQHAVRNKQNFWAVKDQLETASR